METARPIVIGLLLLFLIYIISNPPGQGGHGGHGDKEGGKDKKH